MEAQSRLNRPSLYDRTFFLFKLFFVYTFPILIQGYKNNGLDFQEINRCPDQDDAELNHRKLERHWNRELKKSKPKLWRALMRTYASFFLVPLLVCLFEECFLRIAQPLLLARVIRYFANDPEITYYDACWSTAGVVGCTMMFITIHHPTMLQAMRIGMKMRISCSGLMYQKALLLSKISTNQTAIGQIINIMSNDMNRMDNFSFFCSYIFVSPIQIAIVVGILYQYFGWTCFIGIGILFLFMPFQALMGWLFSIVRLGTARLTDTRLRFMNEIISGIRVIKMYSWEVPFANRVADARRLEVKKVRQSCWLKALNLSVFFVVNRVILFILFVTYVLMGNRLIPEAVFVSIALFNTLRLTVTYFFPEAIHTGSELRITCQRIQNFLLLDENSSTIDRHFINQKEKKIFKKQNKQNLLNNVQIVSFSASNDSLNKSENIFDSSLYSKPLIADDCSKLIVNNISAKWSNDLIRPTLSNISVRLKPGDLLAVIGPVGSGKSSLLMALLRELPLISGQIDIEGSIAYASQDPWSFNESVRNNILFGLKYDAQRYQEIIRVCALERDLTLMPFGDRTLVGEKGVSLSGGQKARINLARAVYRNSNICLLDDPLSAVDTAVAEHIFEKCIMDYLKNKIRILVTHQIQFIEKATKIMILNEGDCMAFGTFAELQQMGIDFMSLLDKNKKNEIESDNENSGEFSDRKKLALSRSNSATLSNDNTKLRTRTLSTGQETAPLPETTPTDIKQIATNEIKMEEEKYQRGSIKFHVYKEYLKAGSAPLWIMVTIIFTIVSQLTFNGSDIFLTNWTDKNQRDLISNEEQVKYILYYFLLIATLFVSTILRSVSFFLICMRASENLHNQIFKRLLQARVSFFDNNPVGRILNRFSKDIGIIDENLPDVAYDLNLTLVQAIGIIITVSLYQWHLVIAAFVLCIFIIFLRNFYIKSARDIKRFEGLARSPVYSHVSTTINGLVSIRAFGVEKWFQKQFYSYQNDHSATWFMYMSASRCLGLMVDWTSTCFISIIALSVIFSKNMSSGAVGLAFSTGLMLTGMTQWGVRQSTEFESHMTSVERVAEYKYLDSETDSEQDSSENNSKSNQNNKTVKPKPNWPKKGTITFDRMFLRYANSEKPVLKNISCTIYGGEKIGIVGRTGAGKSSIIAALFRLTEPDGNIEIDGKNTKSIPLNYLRQNISIIPQDPVVFTGTVRYNLDPFNEFTDEAIWLALEEVQLKNQVENYQEKLESMISESGSNLSVGQRQLICLARAILKNNKILILDEATANVDHQTDTLIQQTTREKFHNCTVLTIAHRLNTIIDCDRVMVLDAGEIIEFDIPYFLLNKRGLFYEMCKKTGRVMYSKLYQLAKIAHKKKLAEIDQDRKS